MRVRMALRPGLSVLMAGLAVGALLLATTGLAVATDATSGSPAAETAGAKLTPAAPEAAPLIPATAAENQGGEEGLPAAAWVGLSIAFALGALLLLAAGGYVFPRRPRH